MILVQDEEDNVENRETRLISGKGQFADDLDFPGMAHLVFVGSPHAHCLDHQPGYG
jgi:CO/xanthine dehydrogenase Mo-binding subunit